MRVYHTAPKGTLEGVEFQKILLDDTTDGIYTSLTIGPDHKLYACSIDGKIKRFVIENDGSLHLERIYKPFGKGSKMTIGLAFDPISTSDSLIVWITYSDTTGGWISFPNVKKTPNKGHWDGYLARLHLSSTSDSVLGNMLVLKDLPRFGPNQENFANSIAFGPDNRLYFAQGANTGMGMCDCKENQEISRESLLSGAILCLDLPKLTDSLPLSVKTHDGGGSYNPYDLQAPLKIYATGLRNAYDLIWHSNGQLYATINGSGGHENIPTSDPESPYYISPDVNISYSGPNNIPVVLGAQPDQNDFMARVEYGGYYGHPNPLRAEYVLNAGDEDVYNNEYDGVRPDSNFRGFTYDFGPHVAPTGLIEYRSNTFDGKLKGCLIVARLVHEDLVILKPGGGNGDIIQDYEGRRMGLEVDGRPLDLIENPETGDIYVSEFSTGTITLFHPIKKESDRPISKTKIAVHKTKAPLSGEEIYGRHCQLCHGAMGVGAVAPSLVDEKWTYGRENIAEVIRNGSEDQSMPAWKDKLSENEIDSVKVFLLSLTN